MATASGLLTVDEFLKLPEHEGQRVELVVGEVVTMAAQVSLMNESRDT
jgi:Uma2 family endonuclease